MWGEVLKPLICSKDPELTTTTAGGGGGLQAAELWHRGRQWSHDKHPHVHTCSQLVATEQASGRLVRLSGCIHTTKASCSREACRGSGGRLDGQIRRSSSGLAADAGWRTQAGEGDGALTVKITTAGVDAEDSRRTADRQTEDPESDRWWNSYVNLNFCSRAHNVEMSLSESVQTEITQQLLDLLSSKFVICHPQMITWLSPLVPPWGWGWLDNNWMHWHLSQIRKRAANNTGYLKWHQQAKTFTIKYLNISGSVPFMNHYQTFSESLSFPSK